MPRQCRRSDTGGASPRPCTESRSPADSQSYLLWPLALPGGSAADEGPPLAGGADASGGGAGAAATREVRPDPPEPSGLDFFAADVLDFFAPDVLDFFAVAELFAEASIPRSLAWLAAALEPELPGAADAAGGSPAVGGTTGCASGAGVEVEEGAGVVAPGPPPPPPPPAEDGASGEAAGSGGSTAVVPRPLSSPAAVPPAVGRSGAGSAALRLSPVTVAASGSGRRSCSGTASATALSRSGSLGRGDGDRSGKPSWAKIATIARAAAAVSPSNAKAVLRIRSGRPFPAKLGSRSDERSLLLKLECTSTSIGRSSSRQSDWISFLNFRFDHLSTEKEPRLTSITTVPSRSVRSVGTRYRARVARVSGVGCP